ncbi:ribonuclease Z [Polaribacter reichenbachii]|uniref:Ribonuclease Z n=2 Tax=Polaribacter reichenbachii TaxID=996801 RepID=A0A1B8U6R1_9FLAO|nr:GLPGLI family protein [Polaribacter reichenbachii]APZ46302.1 ribonuclease Z [Polaribacter reichenbachii]AUC20165.1 ribonuclease Z [Polaribacter reichenbachii]OBY67576.1 ribonuclease Z [Polaribacter reichenbachii]
MKSVFTFVLVLATNILFSQNDFQGKATYMSKTTMDMSRFEGRSEQEKKQIMARMKNFLEKTYTLSFNKTESEFKENIKLDAPGGSSGRRWGASNGKGSIYKNLKEKEMIEDVEMFSKRFLVVEEMEQPKWELSTETKKIGQYTCYKATLVKVDTSVDFGSIFGRRGRGGAPKSDNKEEEKEPEVRTLAVTAWYTPQIPVSSGPDSYYGLPGLILELNTGKTTMLCTEIVLNPSEDLEIDKPKKGKKVNREEYNKIIKVKTDELKERFQGGNRGGGRRF